MPSFYIKKQIKTPYKVSLKKVKIWFQILNNDLFKNKLPEFNEVFILTEWKSKIDPSKEIDGECIEHEKGKCDLYILNQYSTELHFVETLAHEMIHLYQSTFQQPLNHGKTFFKWTKKFSQYGLTLSI